MDNLCLLWADLNMAVSLWLKENSLSFSPVLLTSLCLISFLSTLSLLSLLWAVWWFHYIIFIHGYMVYLNKSLLDSYTFYLSVHVPFVFPVLFSTCLILYLYKPMLGTFWFTSHLLTEGLPRSGTYKVFIQRNHNQININYSQFIISNFWHSVILMCELFCLHFSAGNRRQQVLAASKFWASLLHTFPVQMGKGIIQSYLSCCSRYQTSSGAATTPAHLHITKVSDSVNH